VGKYVYLLKMRYISKCEWFPKTLKVSKKRSIDVLLNRYDTSVETLLESIIMSVTSVTSCVTSLVQSFTSVTSCVLHLCSLSQVGRHVYCTSTVCHKCDVMCVVLVQFVTSVTSCVLC